MVGSLPVLITKKALTFAEVRESDQLWLELGGAEAQSRGLKNITDADVADWAQGMQDMLDCFVVGDIVVYLDGSFWTIDSEKVEFCGYFARHKLARLPRREALTDPRVQRSVLGTKIIRSNVNCRTGARTRCIGPITPCTI